MKVIQPSLSGPFFLPQTKVSALLVNFDIYVSDARGIVGRESLLNIFFIVRLYVCFNTFTYVSYLYGVF